MNPNSGIQIHRTNSKAELARKQVNAQLIRAPPKLHRSKRKNRDFINIHILPSSTAETPFLKLISGLPFIFPSIQTQHVSKHEGLGFTGRR